MRAALSLCALLLASGLSAQAPQTSKPKKTAVPPEVQQGYKLIHSGEIAKALAHFKQLLKEQPGNKFSTKAIRPLTQAVQLEKILEQKKHPKWAAAASWLHTFYTRNKVPTRLLSLCERAHERFPEQATWGIRFANELAAQKQPKKALEVYQELIAKHDQSSLRAMAAVLAARCKDNKLALEMLGHIKADETDPGACYNAACAYALMKDVEHGSKMLQRAFEQTPPSQLNATKRQAMFDEDLENLSGSDSFAAALEASSKVPEPKKVSAGCEGCPSKGSCSDDEKESCGDKKEEAAPKK
jgi:tetratricopeptide (TPR) repeat protein